jgi:hypothetical protein
MTTATTSMVDPTGPPPLFISSNILVFCLTINLNALRLIGEMRNRADPDDEDLPAKYLLYVFAVMVAIAIAAVSTFFIVISR